MTKTSLRNWKTIRSTLSAPSLLKPYERDKMTEQENTLAYSKRFDQDGFVLVPDVVPPELLERVIPRMEAVMNGDYETGIEPRRSWYPGSDPTCIRKIDQVHLSDRTLLELVTLPALGKLAAAVTGAKMVQLWAMQMLYKPPGGHQSGSVGWHQDKQYWTYWNGQLFTAWIAISDVTEESGPMRFLKGSHRWGFLNSGDYFGHDLDALKQSIQVPEGENWEEVPAILPPGGVSFHQSHTYHGSGANVSDSPRLSFALHLRTEKAEPIPGSNDYYVSHLDDPSYCPVIYREE